MLGAFLAGAAYVVLAGVRLHSFPARVLILGGIAFGAIGGLLALVFPPLEAVHYRRRSASAPAGAFSAFLGALCVIAIFETILYAILRRVAMTMELLTRESILVTLLWPIGAVFVFVAFPRVRDVVLRRIPERHLPRWPFAAAVSAALALIAIVSAPARLDAPETPLDPLAERATPKVVLIAIDGLGDEILDRYRSSMPHLDAMAAKSARGRIHPEPPILSDTIFTAMVTGVPAITNGVNNFELYVDAPDYQPIPLDRVYDDPAGALFLIPELWAWRRGGMSVLPSTRTHRVGIPLWTLEKAGRVGVVCWPATWPAEPVHGVMISDRFPPDHSEILFHLRTDFPDVTFPRDVAKSITRFRRHRGDPPDPRLLTLAALTSSEIAGFNVASEGEVNALPKNVPFTNPYFGWSSDISCMEAAKYVEETFHPSFLVVYLQGVDHTEHAFLPGPDGIIAGFSRKDSERLASFLPNYLRITDDELGYFYELGDANTTTIVVSDHGMKTEENELFKNWHAGNGIFLARGPGFTPGADLGEHPPENWRDIIESAFK